MAGPRWQRRSGSDFAFFQAHNGFARGAVGGEYEDILCNEFGPALHFVNVRAQRYKCQARARPRPRPRSAAPQRPCRHASAPLRLAHREASCRAPISGARTSAERLGTRCAANHPRSRRLSADQVAPKPGTAARAPFGVLP